MTGSYNSPRRAEAAAGTRTAILTSARTMFLERGYVDVTVSDIAKAARVAVQTVYASAGGKAAILSALLQPAVESHIVDETLAAVAVADDPRRVIDLTADGTRRAHEGNWEILYGLFRHAPAETAAREVHNATITAYLDALGTIVDRLIRLNGLAPGLDRARALDLLWFYLGQSAWFTLVGDRGWSFDQAQAWLANSARHALLADPAATA
jgi:AcrR family transcriptional regulator